MKVAARILCHCLLLGACAAQPAYKQTVPNLQRIDAYTPFGVFPNARTRNTPHPDVVGVKFVLLVADSNVDKDGYTTLMRRALLSLGFAEVIESPELASRLQAAGLTSSQSVIADEALMAHAAEVLGSFVIVDSRIYRRGENNWISSLAVVNPTDSNVLLQHDLAGFGYTHGVEAELIYPMFNLMRAWYRSSPTASRQR